MPSLATLPIDQTPVAILDFETTGLSPGRDRVVEVAVVRVEPGREPQLVLDSLVNPRRRMACTEIHGITDADVADAPEFGEIADDVLAAIGGCALAAYNVYFDMKFLTHELERAGRDGTAPHFCLMYLRPMLELGPRCTLGDACQEHGISMGDQHHAAADAMPEAALYRFYQSIFRERQIRTFGELAELRRYRFCESFEFELPPRGARPSCRRLKPRSASSGLNGGRVARGDGETVERRQWNVAPPAADRAPARPPSPSAKQDLGGRAPVVRTSIEITFADARQAALREYWDVLKLVIADLEVSDPEMAYVRRKQQSLGLEEAEIRAQHARVFASVIAQFTDDRRIDDRERDKLRRLHIALSRLGWAPGE
jgi:DNA polymerase III epsilon subunit-like protein